MAEDIIGRLKVLRDLPVGSPLPDTMANNNWGVFISALCADAVTEIESLRALAGPVKPSPSFRDIRDKTSG